MIIIIENTNKIHPVQHARMKTGLHLGIDRFVLKIQLQEGLVNFGGRPKQTHKRSISRYIFYVEFDSKSKLLIKASIASKTKAISLYVCRFHSQYQYDVT